VEYWTIETGGSRGGLLKRPVHTLRLDPGRMPLSAHSR
jgi:hypothetical protein